MMAKQKQLETRQKYIMQFRNPNCTEIPDLELGTSKRLCMSFFCEFNAYNLYLFCMSLDKKSHCVCNHAFNLELSQENNL